MHALGHNQSGVAALTILIGLQFRDRVVILPSSATCHRRHHNAITKSQVTHFKGAIQVRILHFLILILGANPAFTEFL